MSIETLHFQKKAHRIQSQRKLSHNHKFVLMLHISAKSKKATQDTGRKILIGIDIPSSAQTPMHDLNHRIPGWILQTVVLAVVHHKGICFSFNRYRCMVDPGHSANGPANHSRIISFCIVRFSTGNLSATRIQHHIFPKTDICPFSRGNGKITNICTQNPFFIGKTDMLFRPG